MQDQQPMEKLAAGLPHYQDPQPLQLKSEPLAKGRLREGPELYDRLAYGDGDIFFGEMDGRLVGWNDPTHVLICGGTRSDKGAALSNTCLDTTDCLLHFTSKGIDASRMAHRRGPGDAHCDGLGQDVLILDGDNLTIGVDEFKGSLNAVGGRGGFLDPDRDDFIARAMRLAICLIALKANETNSYFGNDARNLIKVLLMYVAGDDLFEGRRTLMTVLNLARSGDQASYQALIAKGKMPLNEEGTPKFDALDVLFHGMMTSDIAGGVVAEGGRYFFDLKNKGGDGGQFAGVRGEMVAAMSWLDAPGMQRLFSEQTRSFSEFRTNPKGLSVFYCMQEDMIETAAAAPRIVFAMFEAAMKEPGPAENGKKVLAWIDEFNALKRMDTIENGMASIAGYASGVKLVLLFQTLAMLKKHYGEEGLQTIYSGCTTRIFFDIRDVYTAEQIMKMGGEKEKVTINQSFAVSQGRSTSQSVSESEQIGTSDNIGTAETVGVHQSMANSASASIGHSYQGSFWAMFLNIPRFWRRGWQSNESESYSASSTLGSNWSRSSNRSFGKSYSRGKTTNRSSGENSNATATITEQRHIRPVLPINEVMDRYSINNPDGRLALVQITGIGFFEVQRIRYWEHAHFYRKFGKDPGHDFVQAPDPHIVRGMAHKAVELIEGGHEFNKQVNWLRGATLAGGACCLAAGAWVPALASLLLLPACDGVVDGATSSPQEIDDLLDQAEDAKWELSDHDTRATDTE